MLLTTLLAAAATLGAGPLSAHAPVSPPQNTSAATAEGTEILRRILVDSLDQAFAGEQTARTRQQGMQVHGLVTRLWANDSTVEHSRAFHVPEVGLFFALDAALPLVKRQGASEPAQGDQPTDDEWERMRGEVRGQLGENGPLFRRLRLAAPVALEIDPAAVDQVVDVVLRTLARHAPRIEGLTPRDTFTVALRLSGRHRTLTQNFQSRDGEFELGFGADEGSLETRPDAISAFVFTTGEDVREQNLVIRIALADLTALTDAGADKLRARAQINRY